METTAIPDYSKEMTLGNKIKEYVLKHGFYIIVPSVDTFDVIAPEGEYKPREW